MGVMGKVDNFGCGKEGVFTSIMGIRSSMPAVAKICKEA